VTRLVLCLALVAALIVLPGRAQAPASDWVAVSNGYANELLAIEMKHRPEIGTRQGLSQYDADASQPTRADEDAARHETEAVLAELRRAAAEPQTPELAEDLAILIHAVELQFRQQDVSRAHDVSFLDASEIVFGGLQSLLDDQMSADRRPAAVARLRKYAGLEPGYRPIADILKERTIAQMAVPGVVYPARGEMETELARDSLYVDDLAARFEKYGLAGWREPLATIKTQLDAYDAWLKATVLPKARTDFRLPPEEYALNMEQVGVDLPPDRLAAMAHQAFDDLQAEMRPIAAKIAAARHLPSSDYRDVMRALKKEQIVGDAILPLYEARLTQIENIIRERHIVSLPERPARIRIGTAAESAQQPAPHMVPPPFVHNTGQQGEFVLPLNIPASSAGGHAEQYDDFTFDAAAWTLIAHEARPGHELQFDSMLEHGVSFARARYAFNSVNVEGWGLYAEYLIEPYMPLEGQLVSLDYRLLRAARAFLDPELQAGRIQPADAYRVLENDVVLSHAFAQEEVERFTYRSPGQATSYFYGYTQLVALRHDVEAALGPRFDQQAFHDFILAQGLLPPDLMRKVVMARFVPSAR
jgi:uncharacterized protein (DUF885 family)